MPGVLRGIRPAGLSDHFQHCYTAVAAAGKKAETIATYLVLTVVEPLSGAISRLTLALDDTPGSPHYELLDLKWFVVIMSPRREGLPIQAGRMMTVTDIPGIITTCPPAPPEAIARLRAELGLELPDEYSSLLAQADGVYANSLTLYSSDNVPERNRTYEVAVYAPGYLTIGDDGGGQAIVLRAGRATSPVYVVGHGSMSSAHLVRVADSLTDWGRLGCPLDADGT